MSLNEVNGGSFRVHVAHQDASFAVSSHVAARLAQEKAEGYHSLEPVHVFQARVGDLRRELIDVLENIQLQGKSVFVYGASTKGNTLMQYCGIDNSMVTAAADRNPEKWGKRTPGTNIPIISEVTARSQQPDYFLVLPWHFKEAFLKREAEFLNGHGKMIFPLPEVTIV